jgi:hypothetical protein
VSRVSTARRTGATLGAAALTALGGLAVPGIAAGAVAGLQDDQLTSGPLSEIDERLPMLKETRTKFTRVDVLWGQVAPTPPVAPRDPNDPAYEWSRIDRIVCGLAQRSIGRMVTVYSAPDWATQNLKGPPEGTEVNPNFPRVGAYRDFMYAISRRYSGRFVPATKDPTCITETLPRVRHWEIWQEPHIEKTLKPQYRGSKRAAFPLYVTMTRLAYPAIRRANGALNGRRAIVIGGVGAPRSSNNRKGNSAIVWMKLLLRSKARFDWYSQHIYAGVAPRRRSKAIPTWATLPRLIEEIDKVKKRRGMKLIISESGYTTKRGVRTGKRAVVNKRQQAVYLRHIYRLKAVRSRRVPLVVWFQLSDNPFWFSGLTEIDGKKKPAYAAFRREAARTKRLPALLRP